MGKYIYLYFMHEGAKERKGRQFIQGYQPKKWLNWDLLLLLFCHLFSNSFSGTHLYQAKVLWHSYSLSGEPAISNDITTCLHL